MGRSKLVTVVQVAAGWLDAHEAGAPTVTVNIELESGGNREWVSWRKGVSGSMTTLEVRRNYGHGRAAGRRVGGQVSLTIPLGLRIERSARTERSAEYAYLPESR